MLACPTRGSHEGEGPARHPWLGSAPLPAGIGCRCTCRAAAAARAAAACAAAAAPAVYKITPSGEQSIWAFYDVGGASLQGLAIDLSDDSIWVVLYTTTNAVAKFDSTGTRVAQVSLPRVGQRICSRTDSSGRVYVAYGDVGGIQSNSGACRVDQAGERGSAAARACGGAAGSCAAPGAGWLRESSQPGSHPHPLSPPTGLLLGAGTGCTTVVTNAQWMKIDNVNLPTNSYP